MSTFLSTSGNIFDIRAVFLPTSIFEHMSFQARLYYLISWILRTPTHHIANSTDFRSDLNLDETDIDLMIFQLENYFQKELTPEQIQGVHTVQDLGRLLRR